MCISELVPWVTGLEGAGQATASDGDVLPARASDGAAIKFPLKKFPINGFDDTTHSGEPELWPVAACKLPQMKS